MMNINIGVIGIGYVGKACIDFFSKNYNIFSYDINNSGSEQSIAALTLKSDIIFICVPTPMNKDGSCNTSIVEDVLQKINRQNKQTTCIIKSTIPPGTSKYLSEKFKFVK